MSGNPAGRRLRGKRFTELFDGMAADFGGVDALTPVQSVMLSQACRLLMRAEREKNAEDAVRLSNAAVRMLGSLRNGRRQPTLRPVETFAELAARAQAEADVRRAAELAADTGGNNAL